MMTGRQFCIHVIGLARFMTCIGLTAGVVYTNAAVAQTIPSAIRGLVDTCINGGDFSSDWLAIKPDDDILKNIIWTDALVYTAGPWPEDGLVDLAVFVAETYQESEIWVEEEHREVGFDVRRHSSGWHATLIYSDASDSPNGLSTICLMWHEVQQPDALGWITQTSYLEPIEPAPAAPFWDVASVFLTASNLTHEVYVDIFGAVLANGILPEAPRTVLFIQRDVNSGAGF